MIIRSPKMFGLSLIILGISAVQLVMAQQVLVTTATRDFNFGPPFMIMLAFVQMIVALVGLGLSLGRK